MDGFTMYFSCGLGALKVAGALLDVGLGARAAGEDTVHVSDETAYVWVYLKTREELDASDLAEQEDWPIQYAQLQVMATVMVRQNNVSAVLAVRIAHALVARFGGMITWDGMDHWESLYRG